jgi:hypothetical protein
MTEAWGLSKNSDNALSETGNIKIFFFSFHSFFIHFSRRSISLRHSTQENNKFSKQIRRICNTK